MEAIFAGNGLNLTLSLKDKEEGNRKRKLECRLPQWKKARIILHILDEVKERGPLEEAGFHIKVSPSKSAPEYRDQYDVYLNKKVFDKLTNPEEDPIVHGGYFVSRSVYDRVDIVYFAV